MSQDHGILDDEVTNCAMLPVVNVTTADTGVFDFDEDAIRILDFWDGSILELDRLHTFEYEREVLFDRHKLAVMRGAAG